jgi:hypothetical protein
VVTAPENVVDSTFVARIITLGRRLYDLIIIMILGRRPSASAGGINLRII